MENLFTQIEMGNIDSCSYQIFFEKKKSFLVDYIAFCGDKHESTDNLPSRGHRLSPYN